ncbi:scyllo-inositol 2-dehydrogenase (NADP(+)) [Tessaracoccus lapidicaptus]|nr:scyllo-inositol 2-dehydrogenase (NADP(+)) [Tessaracoccus lapidicaptus]
MALMRIGVVGYGMGGRIFHAPFIQAADGLELAGIVTRSATRRAEAAADLPGVPVFDSLTALLDSGVDAVTITTPPETRRELVLEAARRGVAIVADKPFAPSAQDARDLVAEVERLGSPLSVFHNRRWDTDIRTLKAVLDGGAVGTPWRVESRFDLDEPGTLDPGPSGGLLRDLGTHLADQLLWLFGPVRQVYAHLDWVDLPEGRTDAGFSVVLRHSSGVSSTMRASKVNHVVARELRVYGSAGSYESRMSDVQAQAVFAGRRPADEGDRWGYEQRERWGVLRTADGDSEVPSQRGAYQDFYAAFARAVAGTGPMPVTGEDAVRLLEVLDAARTSALEGRAVDL